MRHIGPHLKTMLDLRHSPSLSHYVNRHSLNNCAIFIVSLLSWICWHRWDKGAAPFSWRRQTQRSGSWASVGGRVTACSLREPALTTGTDSVPCISFAGLFMHARMRICDKPTSVLVGQHKSSSHACLCFVFARVPTCSTFHVQFAIARVAFALLSSTQYCSIVPPCGLIHSRQGLSVLALLLAQH